MLSRWNDQEAAQYSDNPVALRAYTSRLLGQEASLVQHGGGNTSVKVARINLFGDKEEILYVKGSGWDLATIEPQGFAPVKMDVLTRMARLETLSDSDMVREQKAAMINPSAPNPSVEAILHAIIPFQFVDHTHSDSVVAITNTPDGAANAREVYGPNVLLIPYTMPGFVLARKIFEATQDLDWDRCEGIVLLNHGVFTFSNDARTAYENMIRLVTKAEEFLARRKAVSTRSAAGARVPRAEELATVRKQLGQTLGVPLLVRMNSSPEAVGFANWEKVASVTSAGTITPDHVIYLKPFPMILDSGIEQSLAKFTADYHAYFTSHQQPGLKELDACPRWAVWPQVGCLNIATTAKALRITDDLTTHNRRCMQWADALGGFKPVSKKDLFEVEYWELEQAKLKLGGGAKPALQGKIAAVTGAASGIGKAIAEELKAHGAAVAALDINPEIEKKFSGDGQLGVVCDVTSLASIESALQKIAAHFGGLDILVTNAGTFPSSKKIDELGEDEWTQTLNVNLSGHWRTIKAAIPLLKQGFDPSVIVVGSKNVPAPGPGASAYSTSKAGLTQLARVAALELAPFGVRVNTIHPDAVFDTGIWSGDVLESRAKNYGLTVDQYKRKNLLKTEITSKNVAQLTAALVGPAFAKTTGAQIPIDGGNDRVI